jgi:hypothetical protein
VCACQDRQQCGELYSAGAAVSIDEWRTNIERPKLGQVEDAENYVREPKFNRWRQKKNDTREGEFA